MQLVSQVLARQSQVQWHFCFLLNPQKASSAQGNKSVTAAGGCGCSPGSGWWLEVSVLGLPLLRGSSPASSPRKTHHLAAAPLPRHGDLGGRGCYSSAPGSCGTAALLSTAPWPSTVSPQCAGIHDVHEPADRGALTTGQQGLRQGAR